VLPALRSLSSRMNRKTCSSTMRNISGPAKCLKRVRPFTVLRDGKVVLIIRAYTLAQARALIAARLSDLTGVTLRASRKGAQR
jgi:hypothetical protein